MTNETAGMYSDIRHALRALARAPIFTVAAVLCLGIGLGANTTIYGLVNAMLLRPLPYQAPERLVAVDLAQSGQEGVGTLSTPYLLDLRAGAGTLAGLAGYAPRTLTFAGREGPEAVDAMAVSGDWFSLLGARPVLGRGFLATESAPGAERVVVVAESFWRDRLGGAADVLGRAITLNGAPATVVGVMPDRYGLSGDREQLWVPLVHDADPTARGTRTLRAIGRLRPGATAAQADRELVGIGERLAREHPATDRDWRPRVRPLRETMVPDDIALVFGVMMGAVGFVLLIACANVANLVLARTASRARELALRSALGARRARVVRLVLVESVLVALAGGALGVAIAYAGTGALRAAVPVSYPAWIVMDVDARVLVYALLLSIATGLAFGMLPALRATRPALAPTLRDGARGSTAGAGARWLRDGLVVGELALSLVLLVGAGLMVKSVLRLSSADPGFTTRGLLTTRVYLGGERYAASATRMEVYRRALERAAALPGVASAEAINAMPLSGNAGSSPIVVEGRPTTDAEPAIADRRAVSPGALALLGVGLVEGRWLTAPEALDSASTTVLVSESLARHHWPAGGAVGRRLRFARLGEGANAPARWLTVVGVVRDVPLHRESANRSRDVVWRPWAAESGRWLTIVARGAGAAAGDPASLAPAMRRALGEVDATLPVREVATADAIVRESLWLPQLYGFLFSCFAAAALVLAVVGVYGVVAYQVAQRVREFGVRVALGASAGDVLRLVVGQGARLAAIGLAIGLVLALGMTRMLASVLAGVSATDPAVFVGVAAALVGAALLAAYVPARRATRVSPVDVLRSE